MKKKEYSTGSSGEQAVMRSCGGWMRRVGGMGLGWQFPSPLSIAGGWRGTVAVFPGGARGAPPTSSRWSRDEWGTGWVCCRLCAAGLYSPGFRLRASWQDNARQQARSRSVNRQPGPGEWGGLGEEPRSQKRDLGHPVFAFEDVTLANADSPAGMTKVKKLRKEASCWGTQLGPGGSVAVGGQWWVPVTVLRQW